MSKIRLQLQTDKPTVKIIPISPERAQAILEHCNERNRSCESRRIDQYAGDMTSGGWLFTGEAIKVSRDGQLLDGQHRLWAVLEAGITLPLLVITGLDPRAQEVMDQGIPRRLHDALMLRGEADPNNLAAALRIVAHYFRDGIPFQAGRAPGMSHGFALKLLDAGSNRVELVEALKFVRNLKPPKWASLSQSTALHFLFAAADEERAVAFTTGLLTGGAATPAVRALRARLVGEWEALEEGQQRAHIKTRTVFMVQAWNASAGEVPAFQWPTAAGFPGVAGLGDDEGLGAQVLAALSDTPPLTAGGVAMKAGCTATEAFQACKRLAAEGRLERWSDGTFSTPRQAAA